MNNYKIGKGSGILLLRKGSPFYRPWASISNEKGSIKCLWCCSEFKVANATGPNGHEETDRHVKLAKELANNLEKPKEDVSKQQIYFTKMEEKVYKRKHFEYKFLNICLGKKNSSIINI